MRYKSITFVLLVLILFITISSCEKENDYILKSDGPKSTKMISEQQQSIFYSDSFINLSSDLKQPILTDTSYLEVNGSVLLMDKLSKSNLNFQFENSSEQEFKIDINFLNDFDDLKFALTIPMSSGNLKKPTTVDTNVIIESSELESFKEATKMVYNVTLVSDYKKLASKDSGLLDLKSSAIYIFGL